MQIRTIRDCRIIQFDYNGKSYQEEGDMKVCWGVICLLQTTVLWGQAAPEAAPAPQSNPPLVQPASPIPPAALPNRQTQMDMNTWQMQRMLRLTAELKAMRDKLDEMKANTAKVKDPAVKQQLQLDNDMWAMMLAHVEVMIAMAPQATRAQNRFPPKQGGYRWQVPASQPAPAAAPASSATPVAPAASAAPASNSSASPNHP